MLDLFIDPENQYFELQDIRTLEMIFNGTLTNKTDFLNARVYGVDNIGGKYGDTLVLSIEFERESNNVL